MFRTGTTTRTIALTTQRYFATASAQYSAAEQQRYEQLKQFVSPVWNKMTEIVVDRASGSWVHAVDGSSYLDFSCGIAVTNTGHCHPRVVKAVQEQSALLFHGQGAIVYHRPMLELCDRLRHLLPHDCFFFSNSGAEAVEGAVKLAKHATSRQNIITFQHSFHGRTGLTMAMSNSKSVYRSRYAPLPSGVLVAPYAYCHRCPTNVDATSRSPKTGCPSVCCGYAEQELELLLRQQSGPEETAAVIVEPVLGEGGYVVPPVSFIKALRKICDQHNILLIADEIQTGFGRTGKYFAMEHFGVKPDITITAKGLASGLPLSLVASSKELMRKWTPSSHGGTYGGNAVACAAACATIDAIKDEKMVENSANRGAALIASLQKLREKYPIKDIRGLGLMVGVEFDEKIVKKGYASDVVKACLREKLIMLSTSCFETIRFIPPINVSQQELETGIERFKKAIASVKFN